MSREMHLFVRFLKLISGFDTLRIPQIHQNCRYEMAITRFLAFSGRLADGNVVASLIWDIK
jgi:hypothetical protein